jgi:shikimate kinase/3-dehydroquinate synthase
VGGNIFLVGLMGAGKTTVGRALAKRLNKRFVDSDHEIEARTGASIPLIFEIEGEQSFRQREAEVIRDLTAQDDIVLATGGGAILNADNRKYLRSRGTVIYLRASVNSILQRTGHDKNRPLLQTADPRKTLEDLSRTREPFYREVADIVVDTGRPNVQFLMQTILAQLDSVQKRVAPDVHTSATDISMVFSNPTPTVLHVDLGERSYPITIGQSLLSNPAVIAAHVGQRAAIVTNTVVAPLYLEPVKKGLTSAGKQVIEIVLPDGEEEKNWASLM